jgi:endonuclease/exonuclease/phosphatase family metal-dependent hydrolase
LIYVAGGWASAATAILRSPRVQVHDPQAFAFPPTSRAVPLTGRTVPLASRAVPLTGRAVPLTGRAVPLTGRTVPLLGRGLPFAGRRLPRRGATLVSVAPPDRSGPLLRVASVHLGVSAPERLDHAEQLVQRLIAARLPVVVAGDLNEQPNGPVWQAFSAIATDPAPEAPMTFSTRRPRRRIDAVLTGPQVETVEYGRWSPDRRDAELASDHLPVLSLIRYRA